MRELLIVLAVAAWLALGWAGWKNGDAHFRDRFAGEGADELRFTMIFGPMNLFVTVMMYGWRLGK